MYIIGKKYLRAMLMTVILRVTNQFNTFVLYEQIIPFKHCMINIYIMEQKRKLFSNAMFQKYINLQIFCGLNNFTP